MDENKDKIFDNEKLTNISQALASSEASEKEGNPLDEAAELLRSYEEGTLPRKNHATCCEECAD